MNLLEARFRTSLTIKEAHSNAKLTEEVKHTTEKNLYFSHGCKMSFTPPTRKEGALLYQYILFFCYEKLSLRSDIYRSVRKGAPLMTLMTDLNIKIKNSLS